MDEPRQLLTPDLQAGPSEVPLALSRPRFDAVWLIPIGLWVGDGTLNGAPWQTACVLGLVALTFFFCERSGQRATASQESTPAPVPA